MILGTDPGPRHRGFGAARAGNGGAERRRRSKAAGKKGVTAELAFQARCSMDALKGMFGMRKAVSDYAELQNGSVGRSACSGKVVCG